MENFYKDKQVVVTGGTGFVGTHFVQALLKLGAKIRIPIHKNPLKFEHPNIQTVQADLNSQDDCRKALKGADYVFHAAGAVSAAGVTTAATPMSPISANLILTTQILEAAWAENVQRIQIFGSSTGYPASDHPIKEDEMWDNPPHPAYFGYGWMRRYIEVLGQFVHSKSSTQVAIVRPTATYGPHDDFAEKTSHVIPALIKRALDKENPFIVWGTGDELRDFLYIEDLIEGCLLTLAKHAECDPINIGYGKAIRIKELVSEILDLTGHSLCTPTFDPTKPTTIPKRTVNVEKSKDILGFTPSTSLRKGLFQTIQWYLNSQKASEMALS